MMLYLETTTILTKLCAIMEILYERETGKVGIVNLVSFWYSIQHVVARGA